MVVHIKYFKDVPGAITANGCKEVADELKGTVQRMHRVSGTKDLQKGVETLDILSTKITQAAKTQNNKLNKEINDDNGPGQLNNSTKR